MLQGAAASRLSAFVLSAGLTLWGKLVEGAAAPRLALYFLVAFVCLLQLADRYWQLPVRMRIRDWLGASGLAVTDLDDDSIEFGFKITDQNNWETAIRQPKGKSFVRITSGMWA